jgi:two-component system, NarL family, sensor histidine kinase BarA
VNKNPDQIAIDVLEGNIQLLADKERLELDKQRLLEMDRLKTEFIGRVSHDLRTPLNSIIGFSELLLAEVDAKAQNRKFHDFISAIHRNGYALLSLINDLLDFASIESGQMPVRRERICLQIVLDDIRAATEPVLAAKKLGVTWTARENLATKFGFLDRRRIGQAVVNLIDNARKFTPEGGQVAIALDADDKQSTFSVTDTGPGIAESDRERIFKSYFQRGGTPSRGAGLGLGLNIVRAIVDRHEGRIEIDSTPGRGSCFRLIIPQT